MKNNLMIIYVSGCPKFDMKEVKQLIGHKLKFNILLSYNTLKNKKDVKKEIPLYSKKIFLDSGAFSAWNSKAIIDINKYIDFTLQNEQYFEVMTSLDVIQGSVKDNKNNFIKMKKAKCKIIPVYHYKEPIELLKFYANNSDYIGLGGTVGIAYNEKRNFFYKCFKEFPNNKEIKFHGFGVNSIPLLYEFPFYSVDSTTIIRAGINGNLFVNGKQWHIGKQFFQKRGEASLNEVKKLSIKYLGKDYSDILVGNNGRQQAKILTILNYKIMSDISFDSDYIYSSKINYLL